MAALPVPPPVPGREVRGSFQALAENWERVASNRLDSTVYLTS